MQNSISNSVHWLKSITRDLSHNRLGAYLRIPGLTIVQGDPPDFPVHDHSMAMILIASPGLRIVFKSHFNAATVSPWAGQVFQAESKLLSSHQVADFVKEFCNLVAGALKHELEMHGLETGISLPLVTRGFDELFFGPEDGKRIFTDLWKLSTPSNSLKCATHIEVMDPRVFMRMKIGEVLSSTSQSGAVEDL